MKGVVVMVVGWWKVEGCSDYCGRKRTTMVEVGWC